MIDFSFKLKNPFTKEIKSKTYLDYDKKISKNKSLEIQISKFDAISIFEIFVNLNWFGRDHAGPSFELDVFGYMFSIQIYDHRHWVYEENTWEEKEDI